jgi:hypothetical protein
VHAHASCTRGRAPPAAINAMVEFNLIGRRFDLLLGSDSNSAQAPSLNRIPCLNPDRQQNVEVAVDWCDPLAVTVAVLQEQWWGNPSLR